ncbi:DUF4199 domain-containing protein [Mucilaginibacter pallidiroseus]|uniref:DUF4199 domain-containing protein n=1 Tax=Mucilaginibacter pallidiroseus TaxID=2599295 RepID=UPI0016446B5F|nr:DUF4199 domain-containing protein [Mucilaginibacter pallidiroseus]
MSEDLNPIIRKNAIPKGLILGVVVAILNIVSYYYIVSIATSYWAIILVPMLFNIILPLVVLLFLVADLRKTIGGFWNLRQAITGIFLMLLLAMAVNYVTVNVVFAKVIEPNMVDNTRNAMVTAVTPILEKSGASQTDIDKKMDEMQKQFDSRKNAGIGPQIKSIVISIIMLFVLALVLGAIYKRERPRYATEGNDPELSI